MTLHAPYDPGNIFAKILRGEMPSVNVFEDEIALAFMDVFPQSEGHTLVVPKNVAARHFLDLPPERVGPFMQRVQTVARAVEAALSPDGLLVTQFNGAPAGQTVFHLHFHIIPRWQARAMSPHAAGKMADAVVLEGVAQRIRACL
jgi:histidine triad (HIT) family protein